MKAPKFWYKPKSRLANLLAPFGGFYRVGARIRRISANPVKAAVPVICVGNIVAGGSGKTPTVLALAAILKDKGLHPAFVTKGYGGTEAGPLEVDLSIHTALQVGDEAILLRRAAPTYVGRDRAAVIKQAECSATHLILDDGLQNPNIIPTLSFLVIDGVTGLGNGHIIPVGPLRESLASCLKRVDYIVMIGDDMTGLKAKITQPIIHATLEPSLPTDFPLLQKFFAFAGIGFPEKFYETCRHLALNVAATQDFPDHHVFTDGDLVFLQKEARRHDARLLTTEKDWVRLPDGFKKLVHVVPVTLKIQNPENLPAPFNS